MARTATEWSSIWLRVVQWWKADFQFVCDVGQIRNRKPFDINCLKGKWMYKINKKYLLGARRGGLGVERLHSNHLNLV